MKKANIVIMGKTGAGKSTLVNTILGEKVAEVGMGGRQTQKNELYSKKLDNLELNVYDTVGLEINENLNKKTLDGIKSRIEQSNSKTGSDDINIVWYCINPNTHKFEPYEEKLINQLIYDYEIPFIIVLSRAFSKKNARQMEEYISNEYPGHCVIPVLAEDYETDAGVRKAYGIAELLHISIDKYASLKEGVLEWKKNNPDIYAANNEELKDKIRIAKRTIKDAGTAAAILGSIPGVSLVALQAPLISAFNSLAHNFEISLDNDAVAELVGSCIVATVFAPLFAIPGLSSVIAKEFVTDICNNFLESILETLRESTPDEIHDPILMAKRLSSSISTRKRG